MADLSALLQDPLAHRALDALVRAETRVTRSLAHEIERRGLSPTAFSMLVVIESAGGSLELRTLRHRLSLSKANASEVTSALESRGLVVRARNVHDRRALDLTITEPAGRIVEELFPGHARRVRDRVHAARRAGEARARAPLPQARARRLATLSQLDQPAVQLVLDRGPGRVALVHPPHLVSP